MAFNSGSNAFASFGAPKPQASTFGVPQQQQPSTSTGGSLFGNQQPQQPAGNLFGQPQQQQQVGGLFGQPVQQPQQQAGSIFGQTTQQQQQPQTIGGGVFGQATGGLFSQPTGQQQQQQQQQQPTTSSSFFGQPAQQSTGLFGQPSQQQQQQPQQGLFGNSIFGSSHAQSTSTNQPQQPQSTGLFGSTLATNGPLQAQATVPTGGFGGSTSIFNNKPPQQQAQTLGFSNANPSQAGPLYTRSTKFNDLAEDQKRLMETLDTFIQGRAQISKELHQRKLGDEPTKGYELLRGIHKDLVNSSTTIRNDLHYTKDLKTKVEQAVQDMIVATRIIDGFKNPQGGGGYLKDHAGFPLEYFTRITEQMKERLAWYKSTIEQIERKLASSASQAQTPQGISSTLQAQHTTFLALAGKTAALDADLQKIKTIYTQLWRSKTGSVRDPFNELDRTLETGGDYGLGDLNVK